MPDPVTAGFQLSPQQRHFCGLHNDAANALAHVAVRLEGPLDVARLKQALKRVVERHEILRTTFQRSSGMKFPFQIVNAKTDKRWEELDFRKLCSSEQDARIADALSDNNKMTLEQMQILRASLLALGSERHVLILSLPALCADHVTLNNLVGEVCANYSGDELGGAEPLQYADYSEWQNDLLQKNDEESQAGKSFWQQHDFSAIPQLVLPFERKPEPNAVFRREAVPVRSGEALAKIDAASGGDAESFLLACWQVLLWRITGQPEIVVGYVSDGRSHEELSGAMGRFAKSLPLHANFEQEPSLMQVMNHARRDRAEAVEYQDYLPLQDTSAGFSVQEKDKLASKTVHGLSFSPYTERCYNDGFHVELLCVRDGSSWSAEVVYDPERFDRTAVNRLGERFAILLTAAVANPNAPAATLPIMDEQERRQVTVEFNRTAAEFHRDKCIHQLFEEHAAQSPQRPALRFGEQELSYAELNDRANQIAHFLRKRGVKSNVAVGLCLERSAEMIVGLLGILKAGGCYVPLVPDNPKARLAHQLSITGAPVVITEEKLLDRLPEFSGEVVCLDRDRGLLEKEPSSNPHHVNHPEDLVYVIYTSGSTGVPKGVAVRHSNLVNYSHFICQRLELEKHPEGLNFATVSTISADLGNTCIFPSLISGGRLHVIGFEMAMAANLFSNYAAQHPIDVLKITPSHLSSLLNSETAGGVLPRKYLVLGGEASSWHLMDRIRKLGDCAIINHYGPTEATVGCCTFPLQQNDVSAWAPATVPIGRPISNDEIYILDQRLQPVPVGVAGELCIGGAGLATGYLNQPEQTAERFITHPFSKDRNARLYRTGDLARFLPDGNIEFLGRIDHQVKIRGFRVEPAEIEAVLKEHPAVTQSVIVPFEDKSGEKRLAAYVVSAKKLKAEELRTFLVYRLPDYMVPSAFVVLESLPLTQNGKVDLRALPSPEEAQAQPEREFVSPRNPEEEKLAGIWVEVLKLDRIGVTDNFFELGGHSLLATQIISRIRNTFRVQVPLHSFLETPTIAGLAEKISHCPAAETEEEEMARLLQELEGISDEEAERLLAGEESKTGGDSSQ